MAHSEAQREYTLESALFDLRHPEHLKTQAAEQWIKSHVAQLMSVGLVKRVEAFELRPDDVLVVTTHDLDMGGPMWAWIKNTVTQQVQAHFGSDTKVMVVDGVELSVLRQPAPDSFQRCDVSVPKQCVLQRGHGGHSHVSNSGTMWPMDDRRTFLPTAPADRVDVHGAAPQRTAPVHPDLAARLVRDDEPRCPVRRERDHIPDALCARQWNHSGPHMDRTAIAHAGNAGEVWE